MKEVNGILHLYKDDENWQKCLNQVIAARKAEDIYRAGAPLPTADRPERYTLAADQNELMMKCCLDTLGNIEGKIFLDLGGGIGWAARRFFKEGAAEGCILDIDEASLPQTTEDLASVLGDGYCIPFIPNCFDFVFDCSALHHFEDKIRVLNEIHRVLKPGGLYLSQGNPPREGENDDDRIKYWEEFGLIETMPEFDEYKDYFTTVFGNFKSIEVEDNMVYIARKET